MEEADVYLDDFSPEQVDVIYEAAEKGLNLVPMAGHLSWQSCAANRWRLQSGMGSLRSRWQWQRIWSAGGSKKGRGVWRTLPDAPLSFCVLNNGEFLCIIKP